MTSHSDRCFLNVGCFGIIDNSVVSTKMGRKMILSDRCRHGGFISGLVLAIILFFAAGKAVNAKLIQPESLLLKVLKSSQNLSQLYFVVEVRVFDPEAFGPLDEKTDESWIPYENTEKAFYQSIVWVRDEYLLVETTDFNGYPLHVFLQEDDRTLSHNLQEDRIFTTEDVVYPYLVFHTKFVSNLKSDLHDMGIAPQRVEMEQRQFHDVYQLGSKSSKVLIDPDTFRVIEIERQIQILGRYYSLGIRFSEWDSQVTKVPKIPRVTEFFIDDRLFKVIRVTKTERKSWQIIRKKNSILKRYRDLLRSRFPFPLETGFTQ